MVKTDRPLPVGGPWAVAELDLQGLVLAYMTRAVAVPGVRPATTMEEAQR